MTTLGAEPKPYLGLSRDLIVLKKPSVRFLHPRLLASGKDCFTFTACLRYLMDPKTSKYPLLVRARVYSRLTRVPPFCTYHLQEISAGSLTFRYRREGLWGCGTAANKECLFLRRQTVTLQKFLSLLHLGE